MWKLFKPNREKKKKKKKPRSTRDLLNGNNKLNCKLWYLAAL